MKRHGGTIACFWLRHSTAKPHGLLERRYAPASEAEHSCKLATRIVAEEAERLKQRFIVKVNWVYI